MGGTSYVQGIYTPGLWSCCEAGAEADTSNQSQFHRQMRRYFASRHRLARLAWSWYTIVHNTVRCETTEPVGSGARS